MMTVGMLHYRKHPDKVKKAYAYAAAAKMEGIHFYYFSFSKVNFQTNTVLGYKYKDGKWCEEECSFPDVIYNAGSAGIGRQSEIEKELRKRIPFTSHPIGNKLTVYNKIVQGEEFRHYLVESRELSSIQSVKQMFSECSKVVIKPVAGRKGEQVMFVEKVSPNEYRLLLNKQELKLTTPALHQYILELLAVNKWIIQPYINSITKDGHPYDFRLHVQKNGEGNWNITSIYPRVTVKGIVSNISSGGYTNLFEDFLRMEFEEDYYNMKRYLEHFALIFASHFDSLYDNTLDELGIDVGIDQNKRAWIYEVNWRPGTPPTYSLELDVARNTIQYAKYLFEVKYERNEQ